MSDRQQRWVISGGIGSGKSAVRRLLEEHGFFTVDSDSVGHEVLARHGAAYREVAAQWPEVVTGKGEIDRSELGRIVFSDRNALRKLESITHPHIFGMINERVQGIPDPVAVEIPLLEHGLGIGWKRVVVDCEDEVRMNRLERRGMASEDASARLQVQPARGAWLARAHIVVPNHDSMALLSQVIERVVSASCPGQQGAVL